MNLVIIKPYEIAIGFALPWTVYDKNHRMLVKMGEVIKSKEQLDNLLALHPSREEISEDNQPISKDSADNYTNISPIEHIRDSAFRLKKIFNSLLNNKPGALEQVTKINDEIMKLGDWDADAALGALHRYTDLSYTVSHPIYTAILCELITKRLNIPNKERLVILNAALTSNLGMIELQEKLYKQSEALHEEQKKTIHQHCEKSARILQAAGLEDTLWLDIIHQHHEKNHGDGYPAKLKESEIIREAKIVDLADRYAAMVAGRA